MKTPLLALPLLVLAVAAVAQPKMPPPPDSAPGKPVEQKIEESPAPVNDKGRFTGKLEDLLVAKNCSPAWFYKEKKKPEENKPERFYIGFGNGQPMFWFQHPASKDGKYPEPPEPGKLFCTRKSASPPDENKKPVQIWNYPGSPAPKGLFAFAYERYKKGDKELAAKVRPIMWWGLSVGQELDELSDEELGKRLASDNSGLGFKN